jgi:hypothetical protein
MREQQSVRHVLEEAVDPHHRMVRAVGSGPETFQIVAPCVVLELENS